MATVALAASFPAQFQTEGADFLFTSRRTCNSPESHSLEASMVVCWSLYPSEVKGQWYSLVPDKEGWVLGGWGRQQMLTIGGGAML